MDNVRISFDVCRQNFRRWASNPRIYVIAILLAIYINTTITGPISKMCYGVKIAVSPWVFPFITGNYSVLALLMFGVVLLFCDAPFLDNSQPYVIVRSGKKAWLVGQFLYIFFASLIYYLYIMLLTFLYLLPVMRYQTGWGKILTTLGSTDAGKQFNTIVFQIDILQNYTPLQAMGLSLLMAVLVGTFLGLLIFTINMKLSRILGAIIASAPPLLVNTIFFYEFLLIYYSPVAWASLAKLDTTGTGLLPTVGYAVFWLIVLILILCVLSFAFMRKKEIEVLPQI